MVDNIMEEIRVCEKCQTKTFCDYCPKCGAKMPDSRSMNKQFWKGTDFDQFRKKQGKQHGNGQASVRSSSTSQLKQEPSYKQGYGMLILASIVAILLFILLVLYPSIDFKGMFE